MEQIVIQEKKGANYVLLEVSGVLNSYTYLDFQTKVFSIVKETKTEIKSYSRLCLFFFRKVLFVKPKSRSF